MSDSSISQELGCHWVEVADIWPELRLMCFTAETTLKFLFFFSLKYCFYFCPKKQSCHGIAAGEKEKLNLSLLQPSPRLTCSQLWAAARRRRRLRQTKWSVLNPGSWIMGGKVAKKLPASCWRLQECGWAPSGGCQVHRGSPACITTLRQCRASVPVWVCGVVLYPHGTSRNQDFLTTRDNRDQVQAKTLCL